MPQQGLVDPNLEVLIRHFARIKERAYEKRTNNEPVPWLRPPLEDWRSGLPIWDGDLMTEQGLIDIHKAFNTDEAERALIKGFTLDSPGNSADGIALSLQIDYAAQAERAYRARTGQSFPRSLAHYSTREKGHGQDTGALVGQALDYFTHILKQGSEGTGGAI